jgi:1,4-alpha-glucan branching enzyme
MDSSLHNILRKFSAGDELRAYAILGCHRAQCDGKNGYIFRVWAPHAQGVSVTGDWNFWNPDDLPMTYLEYGVWEAFSVYAKEGDAYKFCVRRANGSTVYKSDPYGFRTCALPDTSNRVCTLEGFEWNDTAYRRQQAKRHLLDSPMNIYEMHFGSWRRKPDGSCYRYDELADELIPYLLDMGYTHVELMPITEYPYDPSWGYQVTGYYAPTARYGSPQQFMTFVDKCHRAGIGVLLDWVPAHFPKDENGLYEFDGTCCYELSDPMMNEHPDWSTRIFDFGKGEVQSFLISNAVYWLEQYHVDGLRVDAVASMLYLDYGRRDFRPNKFGGRENLEAIAFLRKLNRAVFSVRRNAITAAEESTAFPMVTKPDYDGGLGFLFKWNMGWMNDMLQYMSLDPLWRKGSHNDLTFSMTYAYSENFILPLSHDEVVHGKGSLINKMPGEYDAKFQNLRAFYGFMMAHPGKKLSFMGNEFAQFIEWRHYEQLEWMLLDYDRHRQMHDWVRDLNHFYLDHSCMWNNDSDWNGFRWISADDNANSVVAFRRIDRRGRELICICNFCPVLREHYRLGLPKPGQYEPVLSSDDLKYGGSGTELLTVTAEREPMHGLQYSGEFTLAPLSAMFYQRKTTPRAKHKG